MVHLCLVFVLLQWKLQNKEGQTTAINEVFLWVKHVIKNAIRLSISAESVLSCDLLSEESYQSVLWINSFANLAPLLSAWKTNTVVSDRTWKRQFCIWKAFSCHNTEERCITATILFHTSSYDNSFKCQTYVCRKSVGESITEAKGRKYAEYHKFLCVRWCCFFCINVIIAPAKSQDSTP